MADGLFSVEGNTIIHEGDAVHENLGFEFGERGIVTAPDGWRWSGTGESGGVFSADVPRESDYASGQSFGSPSETHPVTGNPMGSWGISKTYRVSEGGHTLDIDAWVHATGTIPSDFTFSSGDTFVGEDDAFVEVHCYAEDGTEQSLADTAKYSTTAIHNLRTRTGVGGYHSRWFPLSHSLTVPNDTVRIEVSLVATDGDDKFHPLGYRAGDAGVLFDDARFSYRTGLVRTAGGGGSSGNASYLNGIDSSGFIQADGSVTYNGSQNFGGNRAINLADPTGPQHAVPKSWSESRYINESDESGLDVNSATNLTGGDSVWKVQNGEVVNGGHSSFGGAQSAINFAIDNGYGTVVFPTGSFDGVDITAPLTIVGRGSPGPTSTNETVFTSPSASQTINLRADDIHIRNLRMGNSDNPAIEDNQRGTIIEGCYISEANGDAILLQGKRGRIIGNTFKPANYTGKGIKSGINSLENSVVANTNTGGVDVSNGTGNSKAGNT
jgi:hypothetical protein